MGEILQQFFDEPSQLGNELFSDAASAVEGIGSALDDAANTVIDVFGEVGDAVGSVVSIGFNDDSPSGGQEGGADEGGAQVEGGAQEGGLQDEGEE
ncbi:hypothetical protein [Paraburkholderia sp. J8-2]|uniref:hypothetical protein n=1 Tax=Paraburkholderia sp. J8-2 TaxID=2805440 RepID=UPI002AB73B95|nr:hypothetical protein [Paraburkholderia sp. J8-2]